MPNCDTYNAASRLCGVEDGRKTQMQACITPLPAYLDSLVERRRR